MKNMVWAIALALLLINCLPAMGAMFDVGNYTIEGGPFLPTFNAEVSKGGSVTWDWNEKGRTTIGIATKRVRPGWRPFKRL
jgi:hypothetical protein